MQKRLKNTGLNNNRSSWGFQKIQSPKRFGPYSEIPYSTVVVLKVDDIERQGD